MYIWPNIDARSCTLCCSGTTLCIAQCECVILALFTQHAKRVRRNTHIAICGSLALPQFSTLSHERRESRKYVVEQKKCVLIFSTTFVWDISHSKKKWVRYDHKCTWAVMPSARHSCQILTQIEFCWHSLKNTWISNLMTIRPVGHE